MQQSGNDCASHNIAIVLHSGWLQGPASGASWNLHIRSEKSDEAGLIMREAVEYRVKGTEMNM